MNIIQRVQGRWNNFEIVLAKGVISLAGKVTAGLVESNDSLPPVYD